MPPAQTAPPPPPPQHQQHEIVALSIPRDIGPAIFSPWQRLSAHHQHHNISTWARRSPITARRTRSPRGTTRYHHLQRQHPVLSASPVSTPTTRVNPPHRMFRPKPSACRPVAACAIRTHPFQPPPASVAHAASRAAAPFSVCTQRVAGASRAKRNPPHCTPTFPIQHARVPSNVAPRRRPAFC
jgi:hypothetical protein